MWKSVFEKKTQNLQVELINKAKTKLNEKIQQKNIFKKLDNQQIQHEEALA